MGHTHEKVVWTVCGCVQSQCRCVDGAKNVRTIPGPCPRHRESATAAPPPPVGAEPAARLARVKVEAWDEFGELMYSYEAVQAASHVVEINVADRPGLYRCTIETRDRPVSTAATGPTTPPAAAGG